MNIEESSDIDEGNSFASIPSIFKNHKRMFVNNNINALCNAIEFDYKFSQTDFDNFIIALCNGKSNGKIHKKSIEMNEIITFFFDNFTPTMKQYKLIASCYKTKDKKNKSSFVWLNTLLKRNCIFTEEQKQLFIDIGYPCSFRLTNNRNEISKEIIDYYIDILKHHDTPNGDIDAIIEFANAIPICTNDMLSYFLSSVIANSPYNVEKLLRILIKKTHDIDDGIYNILMNEEFECFLQKHINILELVKKLPPPISFVKYVVNLNGNGNIFKILLVFIESGYVVDEQILNIFLLRTPLLVYKLKRGDNIPIDANKLIALNTNKHYDENYIDSSDDSGECTTSYSSDDIYSYELRSFSESNNSCESEISDLKGYEKNAKKVNYTVSGVKKQLKYNKYLHIQIFTIDLFELFNTKPTCETFKTICTIGHEPTFDKFISKYKMTPNKDCLDASIMGNNIKIIAKMLQYRILPDSATLYQLGNTCDYNRNKNTTQRIIELLIEYGLKIDISNVECALSNGIAIHNLERFNIQYDENIYFMCFKYNYFPREYIKRFTIDSSILELRHKFKKCTHRQVIQYIKENNVVPDRYCIDNAIMYGNYELTSVFCKRLKCKPTMLSLLHTSKGIDLLKHTQCKNLMRDFIGSVNVTPEYMATQYDNIDLESAKCLIEEY